MKKQFLQPDKPILLWSILLSVLLFVFTIVSLAVFAKNNTFHLHIWLSSTSWKEYDSFLTFYGIVYGATALSSAFVFLGVYLFRKNNRRIIAPRFHKG